MKRLVSKIDFAEMVNVSPAAITKACNNKLKPAFDGKRIDINHSCVIEYMKRKESQQLRKSSNSEESEKLKKVNLNETIKDDFAIISGKQKVDKKIKEILSKSKINNNDFDDTDDNFQDDDLEEYEFVKVPNKKRKTANDNLRENNTSLCTDSGREIPEHIRKYLKYTVEDVINEFGTEVALNDFLLSIKRIEDIETARIKNDKSKGLLVERELIEKGILNPMDSAFTKLLTDGSKTITKRLLAKKESGLTLQELEEFTSNQISSFLKVLKQSIKRTLEQMDLNVK